MVIPTAVLAWRDRRQSEAFTLDLRSWDAFGNVATPEPAATDVAECADYIEMPESVQSCVATWEAALSLPNILCPVSIGLGVFRQVFRFEMQSLVAR